MMCKPSFPFPVSFFGLFFSGLVCGLAPCAALAIDFAIDVPPTSSISNAGEEGELVEEAELGAEELPNEQVPNGKMPNGKMPIRNLTNQPTARQALPSRVRPELKKGLQAQDARKANQSMRNEAFPQMSCLVENVAFWERIYSEVTEDEMLIHDKDDLSVLYAKVSVPPLHQKAQRMSVMKSWRARFEDLFSSAAAALEQGNPLSIEEERILKVLPAEKRTSKWLLSAKDSLRFQGGMMERFNSGIQRSLQHIPVIHNILASQGLPGDLVHLPHVESSYVTFARSKVGAVGLWQIMPGTMRILMGQKYISKRMDVGIATQAAAKLLAQNYAATQSWPLALTAYNHGLNGVLRAVRTTGSKDLCTIIERYESRSFRFASSNFYAQFLAARNLALVRYKTLANKRGGNRVLKEVLARHAKEGSS